MKKRRKRKYKWNMYDADSVIRMLERNLKCTNIAKKIRAPLKKIQEIKAQLYGEWRKRV